MSDGYLLIGAFSRASQLPTGTLRFYHEVGLLVPAKVDPVSGYRAYDPDQLSDAAVIRGLRQLDLPLDQLREIVEARDPEVTRRVLADHAVVMQDRLDTVTRVVADIQAGVEEPLAHTPVRVCDLPAADALAVRGVIDLGSYEGFFDRAYALIFALAARLGVEPSGHPAALIPSEVADDGPWPVEAYLPLAAPVALPADRGQVHLGEVPAARVAVLTHTGPYETLAATYSALGRWVGTHAVPTGQQVREVYVVHAGHAEPGAFQTEIQWPIEATH